MYNNKQKDPFACCHTLCPVQNSSTQQKLITINSFAGKANYYGTHVVQKKKVLCVAEKRS